MKNEETKALNASLCVFIFLLAAGLGWVVAGELL